MVAYSSEGDDDGDDGFEGSAGAGFLDPQADLGDHLAPDFSVGAPFETVDPAVDPQPHVDTGEPDGVLYTVTNPPGTVAVSTLGDGRVQRIDLAPNVASSTEAQLADEIVVIAGLATQRARAAQFSYMLEGMQNHGHDTVATRDFLNRDVGLPSPEDADATEARIFATRYAGDHD